MPRGWLDGMRRPGAGVAGSDDEAPSNLYALPITNSRAESGAVLMTRHVPFPAKSVIDSYVQVERLLSKFLEAVPYVDEHREVWSPRLTTVLLEAASQFDSLLKFRATASEFAPPKPADIRYYFKTFGEELAKRWVLFVGTDPVVPLRPFTEWERLPSYEQDKYTSLAWWNSYTALKHDRFRNQTEATLQNSVNAAAALFLAILRTDECRSFVAEAFRCPSKQGSAAPHIPEDYANPHIVYGTIESKLFVYPVGWTDRPISRRDTWDHRQANPRFRQWFDEYSDSQS
jgi:hypothetical protein